MRSLYSYGPSLNIICDFPMAVFYWSDFSVIDKILCFHIALCPLTRLLLVIHRTHSFYKRTFKNCFLPDVFSDYSYFKGDIADVRGNQFLPLKAFLL